MLVTDTDTKHEHGVNYVRPIDTIIIHCSASDFGSAPLIDEWHRNRGWKGIGYHYVILNGTRSARGGYSVRFDGLVESGRPVEQMGAHVRGHNETSIGICLIGERLFTPVQLLEALPELVGDLMSDFNLALNNVFGHNYFAEKECPGFDVARYLRTLRHLGRF